MCCCDKRSTTVGNALRGVPGGRRFSPSWNAAEADPYRRTAPQSTALTSWIGKAGAAVYNVVSWLPAKVATFLTQGALQALLLGGMLIWMMLGIALCKLGVILVVMTSPFILLPSTSKIFWSAVKTMIYPSIYPAMLIVIMQMLGALTSWIGTIAGLTGGMALILSQLPLLLGW